MQSPIGSELDGPLNPQTNKQKTNTQDHHVYGIRVTYSSITVFLQGR